jgi:hypothetical protein
MQWMLKKNKPVYYEFNDTNLKIMNRTIFIFISFLLSWQLQAQFYIGPGAAVAVNGSGVTVITLENLDFVNEGDFESGVSDIYFVSNDGSDLSIDGSSSTDFDYLYVHTGGQQLVLKQDIETNRVLFQNGQFDLNGNNVFLKNLIVDENESSHFIGPNGGAIIHQTTLNAPAGANPGHLGASITSSANLGAVTISRTHQPAMDAGGESINRRYTITPANNSGLNATLRFAYFDSELNGLPESELELWEDNGSGWALEGTTARDASANWLELSGINAFSEWTAADGTFTNIVELSDQSILQIGAIFPNPVKAGTEEINLPISSHRAVEAQLILNDNTGRSLWQQQRLLVPGQNNLSVNIQELTPGLYHLQLLLEGTSNSLKIIII